MAHFGSTPANVPARLQHGAAPSFTRSPQVGPAKTPVERTNRYGSKCVNCGVWVEAGVGRLTNESGRWVVSHIPPCPTPAAKVPLSAEGSLTATATTTAPLLLDGRYTLEKSGTHRTFRLRTQSSKDDFMPGKQIIGYLNGPDNEHDYMNFGTVQNGRLLVWAKHRDNASLLADAQVMLANPYAKGVLKAAHCFRCHADLTVPESVKRGFGPTCVSKGV
jgi:hypothetical protein